MTTPQHAALQPQPAEVSDEELLTAYNSIDPCNESPTDRLIRRLRAILALRTAQQATPEPLTGCNCRWKGDTQVEWCEHHRAHLDAIHEWAQRAKSAEAKLKATPEPVGEPFGWWFTEDPEVFSMPGSGFRRFPNKPQHTVECVPLYTHPAPAPQQVPMPEPVQRLCRYAGQTMRTARNPNITAREAIEIGDYLAAIGITAQAKGGV